MAKGADYSDLANIKTAKQKKQEALENTINEDITAIDEAISSDDEAQMKHIHMMIDGKYSAVMPDCPEWLLPEAKKEWERLADLMNQMGVLTEVDMAAFAAYCQSYARWKEAQEHIDSEGSTFETDKGYQQQTPWVGIANTNQKLMLQAASEFGLTPSSRSRIVAGSAKGKEPEDEMEALLGGDS